MPEPVHLLTGPSYQVVAIQGLLDEAGIPTRLVRLEEPVLAHVSAGYAGIPETMLAAELLVPASDLERAHALVASLPPEQRPPLGDELPDETPFAGDEHDDEDDDDDDPAPEQDAAPPALDDPVRWAALIGSAVAASYLLVRWLSS